MQFGIIGSGSWGTALAKMLTDNGQSIHWWNRSETAIAQFKEKAHNPNYLSAARFNLSRLTFSSNVQEVIKALRAHPALELSRQQMLQYAHDARTALGPLPVNDVTGALYALCDAIIDRTA